MDVSNEIKSSYNRTIKEDSNMFNTNKEIIHHALTMWMNYIQTGDVTMSTEDAKNCGEEEKIQALSIEQMEFLVKLDKLRKKMLTNNK